MGPLGNGHRRLVLGAPLGSRGRGDLLTSSGLGALRAVVFDVDGTLVDSERHGHRVAFNLAFEELGLPYSWDEDEYGKLLRVTGGRRRIEAYLAGRGVGEAERTELAAALHARKTAILSRMIDEGRLQARPGSTRLVRELADRGCDLAVATTGSRAWVVRLLDRVAPGSPFRVVVAGDEVSGRKPDPEAYVKALDRLGVGRGTAVAVEDSAEGLAAAKGAGLACAVVVNSYTADHDLSAADLVLDGFGEKGRPARVLADRCASGCDGILDADVLVRVLEGRR